MKGRIIAMFFIIASQLGNAAVLTVSNDPTRPAQYNDLATAYAAANAGDTLYVYGSPTAYGDLTLTKSITIIGGGFNTRSEKFNQSRMNIFTLSNNVSNVILEGLCLDRVSLNTVTAFDYSNIIIKNCCIFVELGTLNSNIQCGCTLNNWLVQNSIITSLTIAYNNGGCTGIHPITTSFLVKNCNILHTQNAGANYNINFVNCQFGYSAGISPGNPSGSFQGPNNCTFDNCMFIKYSFPQNGNSTNNLFHNCLTYLTVTPSVNFDLNNWPDGSTNSATGTVVNQNPLWVTDAPNVFNNGSIGAHISWDPALQGGSPAIGAGTGGTDIGLTGGSTPYDYHAEPNIPIVRKFQIVNSIVPPNGILTVKSTATKAQ